MAFSNRALNLIVPPGAGTAPRIVIGPDNIPSELVAYYANFTVATAIIYEMTPLSYTYYVVLNTSTHAVGVVSSGVVMETYHITPNGGRFFLNFGSDVGLGANPGGDIYIANTVDLQFQQDSNAFSAGRGFVDSSVPGASSAAIGAEATVHTITNMVWREGRAYEILLGGRLNTSAGNTCIFQLRRTNLAGAILSTYGGYTFPAAVVGWPLSERTVLRRGLGSGDLTQSLVCTLQASVGSGTHIHAGGRPRFLEIRDIGHYSDHLEGVVV